MLIFANELRHGDEMVDPNGNLIVLDPGTTLSSPDVIFDVLSVDSDFEQSDWALPPFARVNVVRNTR